MEQKILQKF